jgi:hypothetical protein
MSQKNGQESIRVVKLRDGSVLVYVPTEDLLEHVEEIARRKANFLRWVAQNLTSMPSDTLKRYLEGTVEELERLRVCVKERALVYDEFTWAWIEYAWAVSSKSIEEVVDRFRSLKDLHEQLDRYGEAVIRKQ